MDAVGELMYIVSIVATLAIAARMYSVWYWRRIDIAGSITVVCLLFVAYWTYCWVRIRLGCMTPEPSIEPYLCSELAWWVRIGVASGLTGIAWWLWKEKK